MLVTQMAFEIGIEPVCIFIYVFICEYVYSIYIGFACAWRERENKDALYL